MILTRNSKNLQNVCGTVRRTLFGKAQAEKLLKSYNVMAMLVLLCGYDCWSLIKQQINRI
jgi:hypothetical protein